MSNVCGAEQHHHKFLSSPKTGGAKLLFKDFIEVPPRKLLQNKKAHHHSGPGSPGGGSYYFYPNDQEMNSLHKFLPFNNADADSDPYSSDHFRMYEFKIRRCTRSRSHDWTDCPFAHPGEKARRRDPRRYHYSGTVCSEYRRGGGCSRGDDCEFAHGVFECWLHPSRYRTEACKDGKNCKRKVCFFAHSPRQLRILPEIDDAAANKNNHCCMFCHHHNSSSSSLSSPTSTLLENMSHLSLSPPLSPAKSSPISRYPPTAERLSKFCSNNSDQMGSAMSYKDVLNELMTSLDAMSFNDAVSSPMSVNINPWVDVNSFDNFIEDHQQQQFVLSPSTPSPLSTSSSSTSSGSVMTNPFGAQRMIYSNDRDTNNGGLAGTPDPDLGWVNELLM